jgi:hypothetical protein
MPGFSKVRDRFKTKNAPKRDLSILKSFRSVVNDIKIEVYRRELNSLSYRRLLRTSTTTKNIPDVEVIPALTNVAAAIVEQ